MRGEACPARWGSSVRPACRTGAWWESFSTSSSASTVASAREDSPDDEAGCRANTLSIFEVLMRRPFNNPDGNPDITNIPISADDERDPREPAPASAASTAREPGVVPPEPGPEDLDPFYEAARAAEDRYIRLMADFENYRRRAMKEREAAEVGAVENAIRPLLNVLDNLERALDHAEPGPLRDGVALTARQFQDALKSSGIQPIEP